MNDANSYMPRHKQNTVRAEPQIALAAKIRLEQFQTPGARVWHFIDLDHFYKDIRQ